MAKPQQIYYSKEAGGSSGRVVSESGRTDGGGAFSLGFKIMFTPEHL